jgi:Tetratricopeptide repeat
MDRGELEGLDRESLVVRAQAAGIRRARILTRPELIDELLRLDPANDEAQLRRSRGFFGRARDLVARVVERGLHLPDAAERIREITGAEAAPSVPPRVEPQAMPTVTLAEIYAAQGHPQRAIETLRRVLEREPDHLAAQALLARLEDDRYVPPPPPLPPEPEVEVERPAEEEDEESSAETLVPAALDEAAKRYVEGPSYDGDGAEFQLAPESLPPAGATHAIIAAEDKDVDALGPTGVYAVVPPPEPDEDDECFAIPLGGGRTFVRWRVSFTGVGAQLAARPGGHFVVRALVVTPSWDGPLRETRDRMIDPDADEVVLEGLPEPAVVRVAVGWLDGDVFVPFAHSPALEVTAHRGLAMWTPRGPVPVLLDDPRVAPLARAFERSRA